VLSRQFDAMALYRLGKPEEARRTLARASELLTGYLGENDQGLGRDWDLLLARVVRREAEATLKK
jgi:hypothetical protein